MRSVIERVSGFRSLTMAEEVAHGHNEWYDSTGYPRGLKGSDIPLPARIVALADVCDALTTKRVYKDARGHDQAMTIVLESSGSQFDPVVVEAFLRCEREFVKLAVELADDPTPSAGTKAPEELIPWLYLKGVSTGDFAEALQALVGSQAAGLHVRTSNPIESTFATVRLRQRRTKGAGSRAACLAMLFKLCKSAERHWRTLNGAKLLPDVIAGIVFKDGGNSSPVCKIF